MEFKAAIGGRLPHQLFHFASRPCAVFHLFGKEPHRVLAVNLGLVERHFSTVQGILDACGRAAE